MAGQGVIEWFRSPESPKCEEVNVACCLVSCWTHEEQAGDCGRLHVIKKKVFCLSKSERLPVCQLFDERPPHSSSANFTSPKV